jgi:glycosyltransferase involved in cell wall biosynthesis
MFLPEKDRIALISVDGDPDREIGQEEAGGQNVYVRQVGLALAACGWQVDMFTRRSSCSQPTIVEHTPNCRTIRLKAGAAKFIGRDNLFDYLPEFVQEFQAFQQKEKIHYPLVHTNYWLSAWVGMELKKHQPLVQVHTYHSLGAVKYKNVDKIPAIAAKRLKIEKACLESADRVIATSPHEEEDLRKLVSKKGKIEIIPCGTDIKRFGILARTVAREKLAIAPDAKVVFYVGRFDRRKGIETLVRAVAKSTWRESENLKLIIAGGSRRDRIDGIERERIEKIVAELGLSGITIFPGLLNDDLPLYYAAADVCVVPSYYEPFGLVALEAMASKTPVVASDVGGLRFTVVPEITGLLVPAKDEEAFGKAIDRILSDPIWRDRMGEVGRLRVEIAFTWEGVGARLSELYSNILATATSASMKLAQRVA